MKLSAKDIKSGNSLITWFFVIILIEGLIYMLWWFTQMVYVFYALIIPPIVYFFYFLFGVRDIVFYTDKGNLVVEKKKLVGNKIEKYPLNNNLGVSLTYKRHVSTSTTGTGSNSQTQTSVTYLHHLYLGNQGRRDEIFKSKSKEVINFVEQLADMIGVTPNYSNSVVGVQTDNPNEYRNSIESYHKTQRRRGLIILIIVIAIVAMIFFGFGIF